VGQSWYGFCDKAASELSACGVLVSQGTRIGRACGSTAATADSAQCGNAWDQCGGAPSPVMYKGNVVSYDVYKGPRCCTSESNCIAKDGYYSQCVPKYVSSADHAFDGITDIALLSKPSEVCAAANKQCGGAPGLYSGPSGVCCDSKLSCVRLNYYYSRCMSAADAAAAVASFGANAAAQASVVAGWQAARTSPPPPAQQQQQQKASSPPPPAQQSPRPPPPAQQQQRPPPPPSPKQRSV
jgi:hypothetical protein